MKNQEVIIVGAGTVGLITALGLARARVKVRVLEAALAATNETRDMVYHWSVLPGLARLGVLGECLAVGMQTRRWAYYPAIGEPITFGLAVAAEQLAYPFNMHLGQGDMTQILLRALAHHPNANVEWGMRVRHVSQDDDGVSVIAENAEGANTYRCSWLVGADGSYSIVRRELGLALAGMTWPERLVATDLRFDFAALGYESVGYLLSPDMGSVVVQIDKTGLWRFTHAESRMLDGESVMQRVRAALDRILPPGATPVVERASSYRIHQRSAERLRVGHVVLVGDAAHVTNPVLTFGITSGLFDAYALIEALSAVVNNDVGDEVLSWYSHVRHRNFWEYTSPRSAEVKQLLFSAHDPGWLEARVARLRATAGDPAALRAYFLDERRCATPSLLAGTERCIVRLDRSGQISSVPAGRNCPRYGY